MSTRIVRRSHSVPFDLQRFAYGGVVVMQQSTFFRRRAFEKVGGFNENFRTQWDGQLLIDFALSGSRFALVDDYWSLFAIYPGSITGSVKYIQQCRRDLAKMFQTITGRDYDRTNKVLFYLARVEYWFRNPRIPLYRIIDNIIRRPEIVV